MMYNTAWQLLWQRYQKNTLPHALLFVGIPGTGKKQFAHQFANAILCQKPDDQGKPCAQCRACLLIQAQSHPDLWIVQPEEANHPIKIDSIREIIHTANQTSLQ